MQLDPNKAPADAAQLEQFQAAQGQLSTALSRLLLVSERYPELKANQNFLSLQAQLEGTENRILGRARQLQQDGAGLQCGGAQFPDKFDRGHARFSAETILHCTTGRGKAAAGPVQF